MREQLLEIKNLHVIYKTDLETVYAVNGVNLSIGTGETLGIVGETGAGKTTTAKAILRILPDKTVLIPEGEIIFNGKNLLGISESDMQKIRGEKIAMIFQDPMTSLNPVMTVGKQVEEALILHNEIGRTREQIRKRVLEVFSLVGIGAERINDYPHQFSGGMKQRVVIAMALACEPELLIADEPTTALDVTIQAQVLLMMRELRERLGTAMILITHDLGIVAQNSDRVAVMYAGEIIEKGTLEDIFDAEKHHPYTIGLFGSIPDLESKSERLCSIAGLMPDPTNLPKGCNFFPRCPHATEKCRIKAPGIFQEGEHLIACHLFTEGV